MPNDNTSLSLLSAYLGKRPRDLLKNRDFRSQILTLIHAGGGGGAVSTVFGRSGAVIASTGDYTFAQIGSTPTTLAGYGISDGATSASVALKQNLVSLTTTGSSGAATFNQSTGALNIPVYAGGVTTFNTRAGAVVPAANDYTFAQLASIPTTLAGYTITDAATLTTAQTLTNKTLTSPIITSISNTGTLTLPTSTDTLVGKATTDIFTNKTFDSAGTGNVFKINGVSITANTGTGSNVLATSPTLVTPVLGVATATSVNKVAFTAPTTSATLTLADGSTWATSGAFSATITTTATTTVTLPTTGTLYGTASGSITSAQLATSLSDETGTGSVVFSASPTFTGAPLSPTAALLTNTTQIATTAFVLANAGEILLASGSVSNAATMDVNFTTWFNLYTYLEIVFYGVVAFTSTANLTAVVSTNGSTFDTSAASYQSTIAYSNTGVGGIGSTSAASMQLTSSSGTTANYTVNGVMRLYNTGSATSYFSQNGQLTGVDSTGAIAQISFGGYRFAQQVTKAIRFVFSAGNITGNWKLYGHN